MKRRDFLRTSGAVGVSLAAPLPLRAATADTAFRHKRSTILGHQMAYIDHGRGQPVVFLHGNPTSSYLWRNILPRIADTHRVIAPDLIGMGKSEQPDLAYTYADHAAHLHGLLDSLDLQNVVLVVHDWGSALGLDWAEQNRDRVAAVAFMEAMLPPVMPFESYEAMGEEIGGMFRALRTPGQGEAMVLEQNFFIEEVLGKIGVATPLDQATLDAYRAPFPTPESRRPTLQWPREIPIGGTPETTDTVIRRYSAWFLQSPMPKLMFHVEPGALIPPQAADWLKANTRNLQTVFLGPGAHFIQEDYPTEIATELARWLAEL